MKRIPLEKKILDKNDQVASQVRAFLRDKNIFSLNLISSPGSGKTSLLEQTLQRGRNQLGMAVLTGDIATDNDAARLGRFCPHVVQITTRGACHLDASMVLRAMSELVTEDIDVLFIENVGNLICPSGFDLGEHAKIVVLSVAEGDDKPIKYPNIFVRADAMILNKIDLLPHVPFDVVTAEENARRVHPGIEIIRTSCVTGEGIDDWLSWLRSRLALSRPNPG